MNREERLISDSLNDIQNIIFYYLENKDYTLIIGDLKQLIIRINDILKNCENEEAKVRINEKLTKAKNLLEKANSLQEAYENEMGR